MPRPFWNPYVMAVWLAQVSHNRLVAIGLYKVDVRIKRNPPSTGEMTHVFDLVATRSRGRRRTHGNNTHRRHHGITVACQAYVLRDIHQPTRRAHSRLIIHSRPSLSHCCCGDAYIPVDDNLCASRRYHGEGVLIITLCAGPLCLMLTRRYYAIKKYIGE